MSIVSNGGYQRVNVDEHAHRTEIREDNIRNSSSNNVCTVRYQDVESVEILLLYDGDGIVLTMNWIKMSSVVLMHQISHCASVAKIKWPDSNSFTNAILEASRRTSSAAVLISCRGQGQRKSNIPHSVWYYSS